MVLALKLVKLTNANKPYRLSLESYFIQVRLMSFFVFTSTRDVDQPRAGQTVPDTSPSEQKEVQPQI